MALNNMGLGFVITARDVASATFGRVEKSFGSLDERIKSGTQAIKSNIGQLKLAFGGFVVGAAALFGAFAIADPAGKFDQAVAKVGAIANATASELGQLESAALDAGLATQFSPIAAAEGLAELAAQGFSAQDSIKALIPALDLAAGGQISVADATVASASAMKAFSIDAEQAAIVTDKLLKTANVTALQASDLSLAIGTVARGATAAKQSLDEMLPSMGLVKNTGVDASVAASSVSSALIEISQNAKKFKAMGIEIADANGAFRPFLDIVLDADKALAGLTDTKRVAKATELFGRFGLTAYSAISGQLNAGIKDATGNVIKGAAAIAFLRDSMAKAGGAAASFRDKLLDNFEGQKTILKGAMQTLAIVIGQPFAQVLKPVVAGLSAMIVAVVKLIQAMPMSLKRFIAGLILAGAALLAIVTGGMLLKMVFGFVVVAVKAVAAAFAGLMAAAWPAVLAIGAIAAAVIAVRAVIRSNLGGVADAFKRVGEVITLAWSGITQLIRDGAFSGAVLAELNKVENSGIKEFAKSVFGIFHRVRRFFQGIAETFSSVAAPAVAQLGQAFGFLVEGIRGVLAELGGPGQKGLRAFATTSSDTFHTLGAVIGFVLGAVVRVIGFAVSTVVGFFGAVAHGVKTIVQGAKWGVGVLNRIGDAIGSWAYDVVQGVKGAVGGALAAIQAFLEPVIAFFDGVHERIVGSLLALRDSLIDIVRQMPSWLRTEGLDQFAGMITQADTSDSRAAMAQTQTFISSLPAEAQTRVAAEQAAFQGADITELIQRTAQLVQVVAEATTRPVVVSVDGEAIATATQRADRSAADRSFSAVAVY